MPEVESLVHRIYGVTGRAQRLSSERDETFRVNCDSGLTCTLKIANPMENPEALAFQDGALLHLEKAMPEVPVPRLIRTREGEKSFQLLQSDGSIRIVRMLSFLDGKLLHQTEPSFQQCASIGKSLAWLGRGLSNYRGRPPEAKLLWDISHTPDLRRLLAYVDPARRALTEDALASFDTRFLPIAPSFRRQIIHNDFNPHNILVDPLHPQRIAGIIDFGDMVQAPLVNDVAVAAAYHVASADWLDTLVALVKAYHLVTPMDHEEFLVLPTLIKARLAMTVTITEWRSFERPDESAYILRNHSASWQGLQRLNTMTEQDLARVLIQSCKE
ncbi:phosphotransferase [Rhizobium sp. KVB221]|uniref:Hydroxylysine kinase n=1 Tax=Rhizobium setariae TaxID=2801340 RepID=A0A936YT53_9HYPH|nr:phosphotransferase [Rhizobium setariae]MBL0372252.1 phosphotransferase [Rhizobium setariae]